MNQFLLYCFRFWPVLKCGNGVVKFSRNPKPTSRFEKILFTLSFFHSLIPWLLGLIHALVNCMLKNAKRTESSTQTAHTQFMRQVSSMTVISTAARPGGEINIYLHYVSSGLKFSRWIAYVQRRAPSHQPRLSP